MRLSSLECVPAKAERRGHQALSAEAGLHAAAGLVSAAGRLQPTHAPQDVSCL